MQMCFAKVLLVFCCVYESVLLHLKHHEYVTVELECQCVESRKLISERLSLILLGKTFGLYYDQLNL